MELLGKDLQALGQEGHADCMDGDLAGLCSEYIALYAVDIADVRFLEVSVCFLADCITRYIHLNIAL